MCKGAHRELLVLALRIVGHIQEHQLVFQPELFTEITGGTVEFLRIRAIWNDRHFAIEGRFRYQMVKEAFAIRAWTRHHQMIVLPEALRECPNPGLPAQPKTNSPGKAPVGEPLVRGKALAHHDSL